METEIETLIDGERFLWRAEGEFAWGAGPPLCRLAGNPLVSRLGEEGCRIIDLPPGTAQRLSEAAAELLGLGRAASLGTYHLRVDEARHLQTIERTRALRFTDFGPSLAGLVGFFGEALGLRLSEVVPELGEDHVQLRINRPSSTDYNPPHRDGSLAIWRNVANVWIPIAGVDKSTSLPVVPGSHRIAERECWQTKPGGVAIGGHRYNVPAIARLRSGPLAMTRSPVEFGQALVFTPYLIHGLAVNHSGARTRMALELRLEVLPSQ